LKIFAVVGRELNIFSALNMGIFIFAGVNLSISSNPDAFSFNSYISRYSSKPIPSSGITGVFIIGCLLPGWDVYGLITYYCLFGLDENGLSMCIGGFVVLGRGGNFSFLVFSFRPGIRALLSVMMVT